MSLINSLLIRLFAKKVGVDQFNNTYFVSNSTNYLGKAKRFVIYNGKDNSSKVPPLWHAWLHYLVDDIPTNTKPYNWQQEHTPNLTGTKYAYDPETFKAQKSETYTKWIPK